MQNDIIKFNFLKLWIRLTALILGIIILTANVLRLYNGEYSLFAIFFGLIFFVTGILEDSWEFSIKKKEAVQKIGLIFWMKKKRIKFSEISSLEIETFKRPARLSSFTEIFIVLKDGKKIIIDRDRTKRLEKPLNNISVVQNIIVQGA